MHVFNQQMKYNYRYQQSIRGGGSYPKKTKVKPDPVLWFPGGDADCGTNAQGKNMFIYMSSKSNNYLGAWLNSHDCIFHITF